MPPVLIRRCSRRSVCGRWALRCCAYGGEPFDVAGPDRSPGAGARDPVEVEVTLPGEATGARRCAVAMVTGALDVVARDASPRSRAVQEAGVNSEVVGEASHQG